MNKFLGQKAIIIFILTFVVIASVIIYFVILKSTNNTSETPVTIEESDDVKYIDGELNIWFLDVGQGDSAIIQFPDGKNMMIDSGSSSGGNVNTVKNALDDMGINCLDYVLLTHTDSDHCTYLDDAISYVSQVKKAYLPKIRSTDYDLDLTNTYPKKSTVAYNNVVKAVKESTYKEDEQVKSTEICFTCGEIVINGEGYTVTMYCRSDAYYTAMNVSDALDANDVSPIIVIEFNGRKVIFTGDANNSDNHTGTNGSAEKAFLDVMASKGISDEDFDADILKVAHHGSRGSSGSDFLDYIDVEYAIVSVGGNADASATAYNLYTERSYTLTGKHCVIKPNTQYGHPTSDVCAESGRLANANVEHAYYTWYNGTITCKIDKTGKITFISDKVAVEGETEIEYAVATPYLSGNTVQYIEAILYEDKNLYIV